MWTTEQKNLGPNRVLVTATRTDGEDVRVFSAEGAVDPKKKAECEAKIADALWDAYRAKVKKDTKVLSGSNIATALDAKESE